MGNVDTKLNFRKAIIQLTSKTQPIDVNDEAFWDQFWSENVSGVRDIFTLVPGHEIRSLREQSPANLATFCYKAVEKLVQAVDNSCRTQREQQTVLNCVRLLMRLLPYIFEDMEWRGFFWSALPASNKRNNTDLTHDEQNVEDGQGAPPLAQSLMSAVCDLLFCPDFTVVANRKLGPDKAEELSAIDSCEYIWEAGVGFAQPPPHYPQFDTHRMELLKLLITCFSETMYQPPVDLTVAPNRWIAYVTSADNRHALPMFTSLLNTVCAYDPVGLGVPYNHLLFSDSLEPLVETALQILIVTLDHDTTVSSSSSTSMSAVTGVTSTSTSANTNNNNIPDNLFINYLSRIHRDEDFQFILRGVTRLLNNPLVQTYLPNSTKKVYFHQELLVFFWKMCDYNKKFLYFVLKSSDVLEILVPILYHLNDARADQSRVGLMHIGVFILLLLSGERNFGVRLNKPYTATIPMDIPVFTGTHADLLIIVFHKIITTGHQRLQPLFDCLLTILVNVSPYLKTLSMVSSTKLLHLLEAFSTPWFLFSSSSNHHLVFFLLEIFNNIIQYQFDGNSNLVYTIIRKRQVFQALVNLPCDYNAITKSLVKRGSGSRRCNSISSNSTGTNSSRRNNQTSNTTATTTTTDLTLSSGSSSNNIIEDVDEIRNEPVMEGSHPALPAEPGTLKATLPDTPDIRLMTEKESAHPASTSSVSTTLSSLHMNDDYAISDDSGSQETSFKRSVQTRGSLRVSSFPDKSSDDDKSDKSVGQWVPTAEWVHSWKSKLPLQTIMRLLQVLVPQVEKICIDKGLTDESEILKFLQHGTLVGLLPVPHPILIRKYQANAGTATWFRTYMWGVIYLRNIEPSIWYDTDVKLFEIQRI